MTDDLVARLRNWEGDYHYPAGLLDEAAAEIERLQALAAGPRPQAAPMKLKTAVEALRVTYQGGREKVDREELLALFDDGLRQGCACQCCDHAEGSDCACDCHADGLCSATPPAPPAVIPQQEGK